MQIGARIDLDRAPVVLRQSRVLGLIIAGFGAGVGYLGLVLSPPPTSLLCAVPTLFIVAMVLLPLLDGLRRVIAPQTLIMDPTGLTIRRWGAERKFRWAEIGNFTGLQAGVAFDVSPSVLSEDRHPGILSGYPILAGRFASVLNEARQRWAVGALDLKAPDLSRRAKVILVLLLVALVGLWIWAKAADPFATCRLGPDEYAASLCPAALLSPKDTAWT